MPPLDPGDLINAVPGILWIQAGAAAAALANAKAIHFGRVERGDRQAAAGVILIHVDFGKLMVGDGVRQAGRESQLGDVETGAVGHGGVLLARISDAKLAQKVRREIGHKTDACVARRVRAHRGSRKRLVDQAERKAVILRAGEVPEDAVLLADVMIEAREPAVDVVHVLAGLEKIVLLPVHLAREVRVGIKLGDVRRDRMDAVGGNHVIWKGVADEGPGSGRIRPRGIGIVDDVQPALRVESVAEIPGLPSGQRNAGQKIVGAALPQAFVVHEEEGAVALDVAA